MASKISLMLKNQAGLSLLEVIAGVAIAGLIIVPVAGIINQFIFIPAELGASIAVMNDARAAVRGIAEDARQATSFTTSTEPDFGTFTWTDRTRFPVSTTSVRYFHDATDSVLMREETVNGAAQTNRVTGSIANYADVSIQQSGDLTTVSVTSSSESITETLTRNASMTVQKKTSSPTPQPTPPPYRLAWDDFESGDLTGGSGWLGDWSIAGSADVTSEDGPFEGTNHLRLQTSVATTTADRSLDLSGQSNVRVQFQAKADAFDPGDVARLLVDDGGGFAVVKVWVDGDDDNIYRAYDFDLSSFTMASEVFIAFDSGISAASGKFFVDDLEVVRSW